VREIAAEWGESWLFGPGKGHLAHDRVFGLGTNAKKIASGGNGSILVRSREGKMEIPAENSFFFIGKSLSPCGAQFWPKTNIPRGLKSPGPVNSVVTIATINKTWLLDRSPRPRLIGY
jgi:hypothetical protein